MTTRRDHHAVLGAPPTATQAEIEAAPRAPARAHHPDANAGDTAAERESMRAARMAGDPLTATEAAALMGRHQDLLRTVIGAGRPAASRAPEDDLLRRRDVERDVERMDRSITRRKPKPGTESALEEGVLAVAEP